MSVWGVSLKLWSFKSFSFQNTCEKLLPFADWGACQLLGVTGRTAHLPAMKFIPKPLPTLFTVSNAVDGLSAVASSLGQA